MNGDNGTSTQAPQMRALLFTDLCDSLILVERIGDAAAAELFQQHDRLVLTLQQQWNGHQIDRSDGLFLLFDRAIDALGFALDYQRNLQRLGEQCGIPIRARAGLHVGEVILWNNSPEAVAFGAKAVEVEGLAKPMAARLMQLARPGQILVSSTAESMVRRLVDKLGETGNGLKWRSFGRWRFKGVPQPLEVFGVHGPSLPSLRRPSATVKAWRDIPLWRRPMAMAAQAAVAFAAILVIWLMARPQPAIAFAERDWVVMADVRNLTGNPLLNDGLNQAFRISLEQSRYVNVLSDLKVRDTMGRMLLSESSSIDRDTAVQIAVRDGARAVLAPSVREVHGQLRVAVDIVDPVTGEAVYTVYSDGHGVSSALVSTDQVVAQLRGRLGEALAQVSQTSAPLPQVATANLDALHAYAKGQTAYGRGQAERSLKFFEIATRSDPRFAMAYLGQLRSLFSLGRLEDARGVLRTVKTMRNRLSTREALYLDAWQMELETVSETAAGEAWKVLAELYPDHHGANVNYGLAAFALGHYAEAERAVARANVEQNGLRSVTLELLGRIQLAQGKTQLALTTLRSAVQMAEGRPNRQLVAALAVAGDTQSASQMLAKLPENSPGQWLEGASLAIDQGKLTSALARVHVAVQACKDDPFVCDLLATVEVGVNAATGTCISPERIGSHLLELMQSSAHVDAAERGQRLYLAAATLYAAQRLGMHAKLASNVAELERLAIQIDDPRARQLITLVRANERRLSGDAAGAIPMLKALVDGGELYQVHSVLASAYVDTGAAQNEAKERAWMRANRGRAYVEFAGSSVLQALNVRDSTVAPARPGCALVSGAS